MKLKSWENFIDQMGKTMDHIHGNLAHTSLAAGQSLSLRKMKTGNSDKEICSLTNLPCIAVSLQHCNDTGCISKNLFAIPSMPKLACQAEALPLPFLTSPRRSRRNHFSAAISRHSPKSMMAGGPI